MIWVENYMKAESQEKFYPLTTLKVFKVFTK